MKKPEPFFRVTFRAEKDAKLENWTVYRDLDDAILAAGGLITSDLAVGSEVFAVKGVKRNFQLPIRLADTN